MHRTGGSRRGLWALAQRPFLPVSGGLRTGGANFANLGLVLGTERARTAETDGGHPGRVGPAQEGPAGHPDPRGPGLGFGPGRMERRRGRETEVTGARRMRGKDAGEAPKMLVSRVPEPSSSFAWRGGSMGEGAVRGLRSLGCRTPQLLLLEAARAGCGGRRWVPPERRGLKRALSRTKGPASGSRSPAPWLREVG